MARQLLKQITRRSGADSWEVIEIYSCPGGDSDTEINNLWENIPMVSVAQVNREAFPVEISGTPNGFSRGRDKIVAKYRTWTTDEWLYDIALKSLGTQGFFPQGLLLTSNSARGQRATRDLEDNIIEGIESENNLGGKEYWRIERGSNIIYRPVPVWRIHSIVLTTPLSRYRTWVDDFNRSVGFVNRSPMRKVGDADSGSRLLIRVNARPLPHDQRFSFVDYDFAGTGDELHTDWNKLTQSRLYKKIVVSVPVRKESTGEPDGDKMADTVRNVTTDTIEDRTLYPTANFSRINNMLNWIS